MSVISHHVQIMTVNFKSSTCYFYTLKGQWVNVPEMGLSNNINLTTVSKNTYVTGFLRSF